jgi:diaminohydroxyphosphoribosylaminopyrimidine deaminase/5-amino-6-(5-phosphoribosylamino)uracil reductase
MRVTLKLATSLDGRIATASGESRWITGPAAREEVHRLRAMHQAVLVGVETAIADDPELTVRLPGFVGVQPARVVLDSRQRLPSNTKLVHEAGRLDTVVISTTDPNNRLTDAGVTVLKVGQQDGRPHLREALDALSDWLAWKLRERLPTTLPEDFEGFVPSLMIEGGGQVAASFLKSGLVDAIEWFRAPIVLGDEGRPAVGEFVLNRLADAPRFKRVAVHEVGDDLWERYERF